MEQEKKYLKTIEEVSDALAEGKVVYDELNFSYQTDKNRFVVYKTELNGVVKYGFGYPNVGDNPYILEPKPLEVKLWHLYEDKNGNKVFIINENKNKSKYPFSGYCKEYSGLMNYSKTGEVWASIEYNLVKEIADLSKYFNKEK